jgi:hypothetical protein
MCLLSVHCNILVNIGLPLISIIVFNKYSKRQAKLCIRTF